eukprot:COSAG02_NODE_32572_length_514_cov_0.959036_1_plen_50_part_01
MDMCMMFVPALAMLAVRSRFSWRNCETPALVASKFLGEDGGHCTPAAISS